MQLDGKVSIVTGGESGIGRAIALALAKEGAAIVVAGLDQPKGQSLVQGIEEAAGKALFVSTDVTAASQVASMLERTLARFGTVDILVNNAGVQYLSPIVALGEHDWDRVLDVNLKGAFLCSKAVLPAMIGRKSGRIINIASAHGKVGSAFKAPYVAAKHGLTGFTKVLALETAEQNITANCICPGYVLTPLVEKQIQEQARLHGIPEAEVAQEVFLKEVPQKRFIGEDEVAGLALYLVSASARGITGQAISIDGGWVMQ